jgi:hypothetical protein
MGVGGGMGAPPQPPRILRLRPRPDFLDLHRGQTWVNLIRLVVRLDLLSLRLFCLLCLRVAIIHIDEIIYYKFLYTALNFFSGIFMSNQGKIFEVMLEPPPGAVGKKCYAVGLVTIERGSRTSRPRYFTTKPPRYVGLCNEIELLPDYSKNIYFRNNYNEETIIHINGPFSSNFNSSQKLGFIEVVCKSEVSLQRLATRKFKESFGRMPREEQKIMTDNMNATGMHDIVFGTQHANNVGGKRRKNTRKGTKRKVRRNRKMTRRRK